MSTRAETFEMAGRQVRRVGFGAMQLPGPRVFGPPTDRAEAIRVLKRAIELGVNHIDTAQFYGPDVSNELIREALHPYPDDLVIATKVGARRDAQGGWVHTLEPEKLVEDVKHNLRALAIERIDVVNLRLQEGEEAPLAELIGPLAELRQEGLIGGIGVSTVTLDQLHEATEHTEVAQVQNLYSVANRGSADVLAETSERGIPFVPYFPLGAAWRNDHVLENPAVTEVAQRRSITPAQTALAWLLYRADNVLLIPGTSSVTHLEENMAVGDIELGPDDLQELDAVAARA